MVGKKQENFFFFSKFLVLIKTHKESNWQVKAKKSKQFIDIFFQFCSPSHFMDPQY